jgi:hypothetical protein
MMTGLNFSPNAFHIGTFGKNFDLVHKGMASHFAHQHYEVEGRPLAWVQLELSPERSITAAIANQIKAACVVVADITPVITSKGLRWNANVMHELGRADQLEVPTFRICDESVRHAVDKVPFDIREARVFWYTPTPKGIKKLCCEFARWYNPQSVAGYYYALPFLENARSIRSELLQWPIGSSRQFRVAVDRWMGTMRGSVSNITQHLVRGSQFELQTTKINGMVDAFLAETFATLTPGSTYLTFSNAAFVGALGSYPSLFHDAVMRGTRERGVVARRLMLIGRREAITHTSFMIMQAHDAVAKAVPEYQIRYALSAEDVGHRDPRHCGLFVWTHGPRCMFQPRYENHDGRVVIVGMDYHDRANDHFGRFEDEWARASQCGIEQFLKQRGGGHGATR